MTRGTLIVTGGSRGIGAATCRLAARQGWAVAVNYRSNAAEAAKVVQAIRDGDGQAAAFRGDSGDPADVARLFADAEAALGPIRGLVANAGVTGPIARVDAVSADTVAEVMRVNVLGAFLAAGEAVRRMSTRHGGQGGVIVTLSSAAAKLGSPGEFVHYAASKGAVDTFTIGLAKEVATEGIRVNGVSPGLIETEIHATAGAPDRVGRLAPLVPMQRPGAAEEVAEAIVWLLSDAASYVTGAIVPVSGGR